MSKEEARLELTILFSNKQESITLNGNSFVFGRSVKSDVVIKDPSFSRSHFKVSIKERVVWIIDLGSANGIYLNNIKMQSHASLALKDNDVIKIDSSETRIIFNKVEISNLPLAKTDSTVEFEADLGTNKNFTNFKAKGDLSSLMNKIIEDANYKASKIIEDAKREATENRLRVVDECDQLIFESQKKAQELKARAKEKAMTEFAEKEKEKMIKNFEEESEKQAKELALMFEQEKNKILKDSEEESLRILNAHHQKKIELAKTLTELEEKVLSRKLEFSKVDQDLDLKKQKQLNTINSEFASKQEALQKTHDELNRNVLLKKNELAKIEQQYNLEKNEQLKLITMQVENKKNEMLDEINAYEIKINNNKNELAKLFDHFENKRNEQNAILSANVELKEKLISEIKLHENILAEIKAKNEIHIEKNKALINASDEEISLLQRKIIEKKDIVEKLGQEKLSLEKSISERQQQNQLEDILLKKKSEHLAEIENQFNKIAKEKELIIPQFQELNNQLVDLHKKIEFASRENLKIESGFAQKNSQLEASFIENKNKYEEEMRKIKKEEKKRLEDLLHNEMIRINKLKEDSLRLVVELEDSITKEILNSSSKIFTSSIGVDRYREVAPQFEKSLRGSLQTGVLKLLQNELNPSSTNKLKNLSSVKNAWKPFALGLSVSAIAFGLLPYVYQEVKNQNDPVHQKMLADAREKALVPIPQVKFAPQKVKELGSTFVKSVIYTEEFCEIFALEKFRSELMKQGSIYLYKQWQIEEEKSIESYAMIFSLVDALKLKRDQINVDYEKRDIGKMVIIENETMKKIEKLLGNGVRLEAALKFQTRFYNDFINQQNTITDPRPQ